MKCRIRRNAEFSTLAATHKNFCYIATTLTYIIRIKLVINRKYIKQYLRYIYYIVKRWGCWIHQPWDIVIKIILMFYIIIAIVGFVTCFLWIFQILKGFIDYFFKFRYFWQPFFITFFNFKWIWFLATFASFFSRAILVFLILFFSFWYFLASV